MPAIRFMWMHTVYKISPTTVKGYEAVEVRLHNGKTTRVHFMGFICKAGLMHLTDGAYAKMVVTEVTANDGEYAEGWTRLNDNQFVLGWRVLCFRNDGPPRWGVFAIVDNTGCPIVMTDKNYNPPPSPKKASLFFLDKKRKQHAGSPPKGNVAIMLKS